MGYRNDIGAFGEDIAADFLERRGCSIVERNVRVGTDELDLVVVEGGATVAVEVKTSAGGADPFEAIDDTKLFRLHRAASAYPSRVDRIDLVAVQIGPQGAAVHWIRGTG